LAENITATTEGNPATGDDALVLPTVPVAPESVAAGQEARTALKGYVMVVVAACCWATSGVLLKQILDNYAPTPMTLAFWRDFLTFVVLFAGVALVRRDLLRVERRDLLPLLGIGVISVGLFHVLWVYAVDLIGVAPAHVFNYTAPAFVVLFSWLLWRERITRGRLAAVLFAFVGTILVAQAYDISQIKLNWIGILVGLGTGVTWATYSVFSKISLGRYSSWTLVTYAFGLSALTILLPQPWRALSFPWSQSPDVWIWLWLLALLPTVVGFSLYTWALQYLSASGAIITATVETVVASILAFLVFGEILAPLQILGGALIVTGVIIISRARE
jgi:DME family drug/metabolite transporter